MSEAAVKSWMGTKIIVFLDTKNLRICTTQFMSLFWSIYLSKTHNFLSIKKEEFSNLDRKNIVSDKYFFLFEFFLLRSNKQIIASAID